MLALLSSEVKDIKEVISIDYKIEDDIILFIAKIELRHDYTCREYRIGKYYIKEGYGGIMTEKGIKEYKNLKSLCKATEKFNAKYTFWYDRVIKYYRENKNKEIN